LIGTGWQRITRGHPAVSIVSEFTGLTNQAGIFVFVNQGSLNASWWGWSFEAGAFPTSYIPTTSVSVTRAADVASMPTNVSWFNANFGTLFAETIYTGQATGGFASLIALGAANPSADFIEQYINQSANAIAAYAKNNNVQLASIGSAPGAVVPGAIMKSANTYQPTTMSVAINGVVPGSSAVTGGSLPAVTQLLFMQPNVNFQAQVSGYIRRVTYWNRALSDTEMQQVTT